jgi:hypothetical protein
MASKIVCRPKVVRVWQARILDGGFVLYVPHYIVVAT